MLRLKEAGLTSTPALRPISDRIVPGEMLAIVGPNGAGKSTLLAMLAGLRQAERGRVELDGRVLDEWSPSELATRRAIVAQQELPSFAWKVRDLVALGGEPSPRRLAGTLEAMQLTSLASRVVTRLSGGEAQRVMIARALCQLAASSEDSEWPRSGGMLLLDEPTSALDIGHQQRLMRLLLRCAHQDGLAIVCVLHDLNLAARYADRVWLLQAGERVAHGRAEEVLTTETITRIFGAELTTLSFSDGRGQALLLER
ncbi:ATP-binding cassette domain-containing protein [Modicisalibacter radicis]|uniref:ATP-binding cassette domain-containing protein n=1 Tax=Halomonas sp. EAR18 TaxID=2518972 RepID=UPI00109C636A|nr:ATP-binding cassette domain-containing protein [Halomonas sp. EAR18]